MQFTVQVVLDGKAYSKGVGNNKKEAKHIAAKNACLEGALDDPPSETTAAAQNTVPSSPVQPTVMTQSNYMCWLNEYGQKNNVLIKAVESTKLEPTNAPLCCRFVVGDKEYPAANGTTKKEVKEEAAKLVYREMFGSAVSQTVDSVPVQCNKDDNQASNVSEIIFAVTNFMGILGHYCQKKNLLLDFVFEKRTGPPHNPQFSYNVVFNITENPLAEGQNSKEAQQKAAQMAWSTLQEQPDWDSKVSIRSSEDSPALLLPPPMSNLTDCLLFLRFLSDYDSIEPLGKGAFGSVFKARQKLLENNFAVKIIRCKEKALREVRALSDLSHDNIVRYYTCWMEDTTYQWDASTDSYSSTQ
ncbi:interferon-induced, double-stranded RNA-activated protein kinase-like [Eucyclogobius newberryi]|uniref:interferon-induced, double-stranded RNA-activated protein kinase-like n=1 Tax=Eucyclogobius newberryi TaxID=166745 RepID=UPI003B5C0640